ncbi:uncharacterized protein H6S33_004548 [Morchella sextelata]|uniref:uncharacterized protein n=1 Tax=Morchella sextelata TaxID=1174677 RepID=UPI001D047259|nr:uncharacterized protein H6S33_004548 [Morchella sextelata]KAH0605326.1 hypothetical protein H6S33_004548 [Morchella sextelata]
MYKIPFELGHQWLQNLRFTGRKNFLETLTSTLATKNPPKRQATVIYGTGGVGKTEIALQYVYKNHTSYTSVFWVNATSLATTNQSFGSILQRIVQHYAINQSSTSPDYLQIAQSLGMPKGLDSDGKLCADIETANTAVKRWFCKQENPGWLLVFDNVDDLESFKISFFIPTCDHGTIIMTSRRPECVDLGAGSGIPVEEMEEADGIELLLKCAKISLPTNSVMVAEIAKKLGYLPLAIYQAGAYICAQKLSLRRYLERFETNFDKLFGKKTPKQPGLEVSR